jgi:hypothetical protein
MESEKRGSEMNISAIDYVIDSCHKEISERVGKLQTETSGGKIAEMQGNIKGYNFLLTLLKEEFDIEDDFINGDESIPIDPNRMERVALTDLCFDFENMLADDRWKALAERLEADETEMGEFLLHDAKAKRDLEVTQGKLEAQTFTRVLFNNIKDAKKRQDDREDEARRNPSLPFVDIEVPEIDISDLP